MAFIPTADCARTDIQLVSAGQQVHNILWFKGATTWTETDRTDLNTALLTWWTTFMRPFYTASVSLSQITTVNQESQSAPSSVLIVSPVVPGTNGGASSANSTAAVATLRTALRGRSYRGRFYAGPLPAAQLTDQITLSLGEAATLIAAFNGLLVAVAALSKTWVVVSKQFNKVQRPAGVATPITAVSVDQYIDSQRRRLGGRGV